MSDEKKQQNDDAPKDGETPDLEVKDDEAEQVKGGWSGIKGGDKGPDTVKYGG